MRFAILLAVAILGIIALMWFMVILPGQRDVVDGYQFDCVVASAIAHKLPLRKPSDSAVRGQAADWNTWETFADECARQGNPPIGV